MTLNGGERFEWLETWEDSPVEVEKDRPEAQLARRCPRCRWLDSITETECFRCGYVFDPVVQMTEGNDADQLAQVSSNYENEPVQINFSGIDNWLDRANAPVNLFDLRRRVLQRGLVPGFDRLLSLSDVNGEIFQHFEHQREVALKALRDMGGCALLADETGLGKTIEAGLIVKELLIRKLIRSILVVVPASLTLQWQEELKDKLGIDIAIVRNFKDWAGEPKIVLCSYATIRGKGVGERLREQNWDMLICDEAHYLKNRSTKQYKAINRITKKYVLLLSATPFHNKLVELKNLLDILKPGLFGSTRAFNKQYVDKKDPRQPLNVHHLKTLLSEVMIRNRRSKVLIQLPPRRACIVHLELTEIEREFYNKVSKFISEEVRHLLGRYKSNNELRLGKMSAHRYAMRSSGRAYSHILALISLQRETCSSPSAVYHTLKKMSNDEDHPAEVREQLAVIADMALKITNPTKFQAVEEILKRFPGKLVVFCEYIATIDDLSSRLNKAGIHALKFDGRLSSRKKMATLKLFKSEARVLIASRAGSEGLNIQFCQNMVNYDLPWNPMSVEQRIGRLHRLGQTGDVNVFNLSVKDTIEARVLELLTHKIKLFSTVIGEIDLILGELSEDKSFEKLLRESWVNSQINGDEASEFNQLGDTFDDARKKYEELKDNQKILDKVS